MDKKSVFEIYYEDDTRSYNYRDELKTSVDKAIDFLLKNQLYYGEFRTENCYRYENSYGQIVEEWNFDSSPFVTALVLYSISFLEEDKKVQKIKEDGIRFLISEMEEGGLWRYWSSKNDKHRAIPPDLDDTCCIAYVLKSNNIKVPDNKEIILNNKNDQGIFYTWILSVSGKEALHSNDNWIINQEEDVCCVVNANVILYFSEDDRCRDAAKYLIEITSNDPNLFFSPYYNHSIIFYYMLSRSIYNKNNLVDSARKNIVDRILSLQKSDGSFGDELKTGLAICSLLNCGFCSQSLTKAIRYLLQSQHPNGSWRRLPLYRGRPAVYGSSELTTAFCLEALARCRLLKLQPHLKQQKHRRLEPFSKFVRLNDWWLYKIPPLLAITYAEILLLNLPVIQSLLTVSALLFAITCVAAYGHIINDCFDVEVDQQVGKSNSMTQFSPWRRTLFCLALAVLGFSLPILMNFGTLPIVLLGINYLLPTLYSAPPFRFKEKGILGIISDAAGAHAIPTLFIATTFSHLVAATTPQVTGLASAATAWSFFAGIRGILLHQLWDRNDDLKSSVKTLVTESDVENIRFWMSRIIFPAEILLLGSLILVISHSKPLVLVFTIFYFLFKLILFKSDSTSTFDPAPAQKSYVIPHDFYEVGLPFILATALSLESEWFAIFLLLQVILFYPGIERRVINLVQFLRGRPQNLNPLQAQLSASQAEVTQLRACIQQTQNQLEQVQDRLQQLQTESQHHLAQTQTELANTQVDLQHVQEQFGQVQDRLRRVIQELAQSESARQISQAEAARFKSYLQHTQGPLGVIDYYRHAIATNPNDIQLYYQALEISPDDAQIHLQLGNTLVRQGQIPEAIATYQSVLQFHPTNFELHFELAKTLEQDRQWEAAIAAYRQVLDLDPTHSLAHQKSGDVLAKCGQLHEASVAYRRALQSQSKVF